MLSKPVETKPDEAKIVDDDDDDEDIPDNSIFLEEELTNRLLSSPRLTYLWNKFMNELAYCAPNAKRKNRVPTSGARKLMRELGYRLGHGQNNLYVEIYGPPGIGKSMVVIRLYLICNHILTKRHITIHFTVTLNYSQSTPAILKYPYSKDERAICVQDEDAELSGTDSERELKAFRNLIRQGRKLGFTLLVCNSDRNPYISNKVSFAIEVWRQIKGWLICLIRSRSGYPIDFILFKYPDKKARDWYEGIKDANIIHLQKTQGMYGTDSSVDDENNRVEEVYKATLSKYPNKILVQDHFAQLAKNLFGKYGDNTWKRIKRLAWDKYTTEYPPAKKRTIIEYHGVNKQPKVEAPRPPQTTNQAMRNAVNKFVTKESIKKEIEFEIVMVPKIGIYSNYQGIQDGYGGRNKEGKPDAIAETDGRPVVIGIEYNLGTKWNSNTIAHDRLESERKYARDKGAECHFWIWNEDKGFWYGPFLVDPNSAEDFTHSWENPLSAEEIEKTGSEVTPQTRAKKSPEARNATETAQTEKPASQKEASKMKAASRTRASLRKEKAVTSES